MGRRKTPIEWKTYNKELVKRGRKLGAHISAMRRFICEHWDTELALMNGGKEGARYQYPESQIMLFLILKTALRNPSYRFLEGFSSVLFANVPSYSILQRRIARLAPDVIAGINRKITRARTKGRGLTIAIDATGIQVNGKYVWIDEKFKSRREREWTKLVLTIDTETGAILSHSLIGKNEHEGSHKNTRKELVNVLENVDETAHVNRMLGDGAFDNYNNFEMLDDLGIEPVIKVKLESCQKARAMARGPWNDRDRKKYFALVRNRVALAQYDWEGYVEANGYGLRGGIEGYIGAYKRLFGEAFTSRRSQTLHNEAAARTLVRNIMI